MKVALFVVAASLVQAGCATGPKEEDHAAHHPPAAAAGPAAPLPGPSDPVMKSMRQMHDRMMAAKTPEARARLMHEHMKAMQDGMGMTGRMHGGKGGMSMGPEMMGRCMAMMETMTKVDQGR